jgi:prepilin-type N-terminal cleavage/methylation domain-containing protein
MLYLKNKNKGFTLVEVVVVVVVLVVLAGILIPSFSKYISEKDFEEKVEGELDDIFQSAQVVFYDLYAEGSHGETADCIISGENQNKNAYKDYKKYPTTYRIADGDNAKNVDIHNNPIASKILSIAGLDIKDNYPNIVLVCAGRYDVYANPDSKYYDPEKAYTVYAVAYQPLWGNDNKNDASTVYNKKQHFFLLKKLGDEKAYKKKLTVIPKGKGCPVSPNTDLNYVEIDGEKIWVQYYMLKGSKDNNVTIDDKLWKYLNKSEA